IEFNLDSQLRGTPEEQMAIMATAAGGPVITVNEGRARLNLPPIPGGDLIFVPLNSVRGGGPQGSPGAPVETPADGNEPVGTTPGNGSQQQVASAQDIASGQYIVLGRETAKASGSQDSAEILADHDLRVQQAESEATHAVFMKESRLRFEERHARMFESFMQRQKSSLPYFDLVRWNKELSDDLLGVALQTVEFFGSDA